MEYKRFRKAWKDLIEGQYKDQMLEYENANTDDFDFTDIIIKRISSCADNKDKNFWVSVTVTLDVAEHEDVNPMPTRYYIKTTPERVSLQHDFLEDNFTEVWDTPSYVEKELIKAILADIVEEFEECFYEEFTTKSFSKLFESHYLSPSQFTDEMRMKYFQKYGEDSMLTKEAQEMFLF